MRTRRRREAPPHFLEALPAFFKRAARFLDRELSPEEKQHFHDYLSTLALWNRAYNLTATPLHEVPERHFFDSLLIEPILPQQARVVDLGSGGGFPAIPLAIIRPDLTFHLVEPVIKKADFLRDFAWHFPSGHLVIHQCRAEHLVANWSGQFTHATSRALGSLEMAAKLAWPLLAEGGQYLAFKGLRLAEELNATSTFPGFEPPVINCPRETTSTRIVILGKSVSRETCEPHPTSNPGGTP